MYIIMELSLENGGGLTGQNVLGSDWKSWTRINFLTIITNKTNF